MSEEIIKVLDALAEKFGLVVDWTSANVIPYLEKLCGKYVNYEIVTSVIWLIFAIIIGVIGFVLYKYIHKNKELGVTRYESISDDYFGRGLIYCSVIAIFATSVAIIMCQIFDIVTCFTFPEIIIIEELKSVYSSMK